jgi:hypothetical protein
LWSLARKRHLADLNKNQYRQSASERNGKISTNFEIPLVAVIIAENIAKNIQLPNCPVNRKSKNDSRTKQYPQRAIIAEKEKEKSSQKLFLQLTQESNCVKNLRGSTRLEYRKKVRSKGL